MSPYVTAVKAWEAKHGRVMSPDEARAFGRAWDAFRPDPKLPRISAAGFGETWVYSAAEAASPAPTSAPSHGGA